MLNFTKTVPTAKQLRAMKNKTQLIVVTEYDRLVVAMVELEREASRLRKAVRKLRKSTVVGAKEMIQFLQNELSQIPGAKAELANQIQNL